MTKGLSIGVGLILCGLLTGSLSRALGDDPATKSPTAKAEGTGQGKEKGGSASVAESYRRIVAEFEAEQNKMRAAAEAAKTEAEAMKVYERMTPDDVVYSRRMVDLALTAPKDPASRDALVWVLNKVYRGDEGEYGAQFARAATLLVDNFADDPEAICVALGIDNIVSRRRDALMEGLYAGAESHQAKGIARLALGQYLKKKVQMVAAARKATGRQSFKYQAYDESGKQVEKTFTPSNDEQGYSVGLRLLDPKAVEVEAERLLEEVAAEYADVRFFTPRTRELEALLKQPQPMWNGRPLTAEEKDKLRAVVERKKTLADVATAHLDDMRNVAEGKPAPEIDAPDIDGKPMKLSSFRGKVVVLVFWGSWCGPCMREVPHERELVERYKDRPFALLGVDCNETKEAARKTMEAEKMTWPQWHDGEEGDGPIVRTYHVRGYPTVVVIDAKGVIRSKDIMGEHLDKLVDTLTKEAESGTATPAGR